jgi:hypothetical protein
MTSSIEDTITSVGSIELVSATGGVNKSVLDISERR